MLPRLDQALVYTMLLITLSGCGSVLTSSTADLAGIAGTGIATSVTRNATTAAGIGLGVAAAANAGLEIVEKRVHRTEQDRIAEAAGPLPPDAVGHWSVTHTIPIESDEHGDLVVTRVLGGDAFACKEIVFSVDTVEHRQPHRAFYTATICRDGEVWKWASAEPATERWGALQ